VNHSNTMQDQQALKESVREFWNSQSCGEVYASGSSFKERMDTQAQERYKLEPYILGFAQFPSGAGKDVLEIGVGMGADHLEWAKAGPKSLTGIDLTERAVGFTSERLKAHGFQPNVRVGDAENLPFPDASFDIVYSYGVIHCSPDTPKAVREIHRVLRPGGTARVLVYHYYSMVGYMLWARYGLLAGRPFRSLADIYAHHLESPGIKAYTVEDARSMFSNFSQADVYTELTFGDLLLGEVGRRRHSGPLLSVARALYPRWLIKRVIRNHGMGLFIAAVK